MTAADNTPDAEGDAPAPGAFGQRARAGHTVPLWEFFHQWFSPLPGIRAVPWRWRYREMRPLLLEAGDVISPAEAERRVLALENPALAGEHLVVDSLYAGLQLILPGEAAPPHRHTATALRFVIEGSGAYTTVNGERASMRPGDFIVTPNWAWHEHHHEGDGPFVWLDVLDVPLVRFLGAGFSEKYPAPVYPTQAPEGMTSASLGSNMRPVGPTPPYAGLFAYPYSDARRALSMTAQSRMSQVMEYINPVSGGPAISTISTFLQRVSGGTTTPARQTSAAAVICVIEGAGALHFGAGDTRQSMDFEPWDIFALPSWVPLQIEAQTDAFLFTASTQAAQQALGIWREGD